MKRFIFVVALFFPVVFFAAFCEARINIFEPWHPGQDSSIDKLYSYQPFLSFIAKDSVYELPFSFTYVSGRKVEVGGRWGIISVDGKVGINDLLLGFKYRFMEESETNPAIIGETGVSLPTADASRGIGSGAVALLLKWQIEKKINEVTGSFGIGVKLNSENNESVKEGNTFSFHIGGSHKYDDLWTFIGEIKGFNHSPSNLKGIDLSGSYQELYLAPGASYLYNKEMGRTVWASLLIGLTDKSQKIGLFISSNY